MSGRLILLPKKSYTPWNPQNIERVLRDERIEREKNARDKKVSMRNDRLRRIRLMKDSNANANGVANANGDRSSAGGLAVSSGLEETNEANNEMPLSTTILVPDNLGMMAVKKTKKETAVGIMPVFLTDGSNNQRNTVTASVTDRNEKDGRQPRWRRQQQQHRVNIHTICRGEGDDDGTTRIDWREDRLKSKLDPMREFTTTMTRSLTHDSPSTKIASTNCDEAEEGKYDMADDRIAVGLDSRTTGPNTEIERRKRRRRRRRRPNHWEDDGCIGRETIQDDGNGRLTDGNQSPCHDDAGGTDRENQRQRWSRKRNKIRRDGVKPKDDAEYMTSSSSCSSSSLSSHEMRRRKRRKKKRHGRSKSRQRRKEDDCVHHCHQRKRNSGRLERQEVRLEKLTTATTQKAASSSRMSKLEEMQHRQRIREEEESKREEDIKSPAARERRRS